MARAAAAILVIFLASCSLVTQTQVSFWNDTPSYTFLAIKIANVDYETALAPNALTPYFPVWQGTYSLYTKGTDGIWYQWPTQQQFARGYSYQLVFSVDASNNLYYSAYIAMVQ